MQDLLSEAGDGQAASKLSHLPPEQAVVDVPHHGTSIGRPINT
jgi:hypothetical protein